MLNRQKYKNIKIIYKQHLTKKYNIKVLIMKFFFFIEKYLNKKSSGTIYRIFIYNILREKI